MRRCKPESELVPGGWRSSLGSHHHSRAPAQLPGMPGKTRTSQAHGPAIAKKPFKRDTATAKPASSRNTPDRSTPYKPRADAAPGAQASGSNRDPVERKRKLDDEPEKAVVRNSLLNAPEEIDFPRGGGSGLTQVEVREAQLEGEHEAKATEDQVRSRLPRSSSLPASPPLARTRPPRSR